MLTDLQTYVLCPVPRGKLLAHCMNPISILEPCHVRGGWNKKKNPPHVLKKKVLYVHSVQYMNNLYCIYSFIQRI